jgi:hypothetical protein
MPSWPTPGDRREDHATAAGEAIGAIYDQAELVIIAAIARLARKVATGAMLPRIAARNLQQTVTSVLSGAAPQARKVLDDAMTGASAEVRDLITPTSTPSLPLPAADRWTQPLAALLDQATDNAAQAAASELAAVTSATAQVTGSTPLPAGSAAAAATARLALPPVPPPDDPYATALGNALDRFAGFPAVLPAPPGRAGDARRARQQGHHGFHRQGRS